MSIVNELKLNKLQDFARENYIPVIQESSCNFLYNYVKKLQPQNMLEIGTAIGYSGIVLLRASKNAKLTTIELDPKRYEMATQNFKEFEVNSRVMQLLGDAKFLLKELDKTYDFIFLDGPKGQYYSYLPLLLNVLKLGGVIVCDNLSFNGWVDNGLVAPHKKRTIVTNLRKFKKEILTRSDLTTTLFDVGDGIAVIEKKK